MYGCVKAQSVWLSRNLPYEDESEEADRADTEQEDEEE